MLNIGAFAPLHFWKLHRVCAEFVCSKRMCVFVVYVVVCMQYLYVFSIYVNVVSSYVQYLYLCVVYDAVTI